MIQVLTMPFVEIKSGRLYYEINGYGRCLLLVHGAWASHEWWRWQVPELSNHYKVLSFDVRGHGQSSRLKEPCSVKIFAKDINELLQEMGMDEVAIVGWSMGGCISIQYCIDFPSKAKALILIATRGHRNPQMKWRMLLQHLIARLTLAMDIASPRKYDRVARRFPGEEAWLQKEVRYMLSPSAPREVFNWIMAYIHNNPHEDYLRVAKSFWEWEADEGLRNINIPTLIMVGDEDRHTPPRFSHLLNAIIPDSKLTVIEKAGHCLPLERHKVVNDEIIKFLKGVSY